MLSNTFDERLDVADEARDGDLRVLIEHERDLVLQSDGLDFAQIGVCAQQLNWDRVHNRFGLDEMGLTLEP